MGRSSSSDLLLPDASLNVKAIQEKLLFYEYAAFCTYSLRQRKSQPAGTLAYHPTYLVYKALSNFAASTGFPTTPSIPLAWHSRMAASSTSAVMPIIEMGRFEERISSN